MVGIDGDPRQANDAFIAVYSAALAQIQPLPVLGISDCLHLFPSTTHDPGYSSGLEWPAPGVERGSNQPGCIKLYILVESSTPRKLFLALVMFYLVVPLGATLAFGLSNGNRVDFSMFQQVFSDYDFTQTLSPSLELSLAVRLRRGGQRKPGEINIAAAK